MLFSVVAALPPLDRFNDAVGEIMQGSLSNAEIKRVRSGCVGMW
jgi:hypothetical protein